MSSAKIWATSEWSSWQISDALRRLQVSHSVAYDKKAKDLVINCSKPQPSWVHVASDVKEVQKNSVNFIVASYAEISYTNYPRLPVDTDLSSVLRYALEYPTEVVPTVRSMTIMDYVNSVAKPSLLNEIQTLIYKIQPYALRKEIQGLVLKYFKSQIGQRVLEHNLKRSFKTVKLIPILRKGAILRAAVARLKTESVEEVAADTGLETFELLYLSKERKK